MSYYLICIDDCTFDSDKESCLERMKKVKWLEIHTMHIV